MNKRSLKTSPHCPSIKASHFTVVAKEPSRTGNDKTGNSVLDTGSDSPTLGRLIWKRAHLHHQWRHKGCQSDLKEKEQKEEKEGNKEEAEEKKKEKEEKKRKKEQEQERKDQLRHFNKHRRGLAEDCTLMSGRLLCARRCCR